MSESYTCHVIHLERGRHHFSPSFTPCVDTTFPRPKLFFFLSKKENPCQNITPWNSKTMSSAAWRRVQTGAVLARGLPYISSRNGDQWSLEKYAHGRKSQAEEGHKTCLFCGLNHRFRSIRSWDHLGMGSGSKKVHQCKPYYLIPSSPLTLSVMYQPDQ